MKKSILYIISGFIFLSSCSEDFLNLSPETSLSSATFFKTEAHFEQALVSAYERLRPIAYHGIFMDEMRSDNTLYTHYAGDRGPYLSTEVFALFLDDETNTAHTAARYNEDFNGISRVNTILSRIEGVDFADAVKTRIKGEAVFLRAFYYSDLVQHYGGVPLQLQEITSEEGAFLPRSSAAEIYGQIITDLTAAIPALPVANTFPQSGRATQGAAKMLLAYAYMSKPEREYAKAQTELTDIVGMNYGLLDNYADVFNPDNKNNKESIFEIQYMEGDAGQQSDFIWRLIPKMDNTEDLLGIKANNYAYTSGGWNVPTQEMVDSYENGDKRLNASVAVAQGIQTGDNFFFETLKEADGYTPVAGKAHYYFVKKYLWPPYAKEFNTDSNWPVFRYSDALLLLAECLVEQNKAAEALPYLNQVRKRAGLPNLSVATKENIAAERRHELAFENHRWTDLIRTGKAVEVMNAFGVTMKSLYGFILPTAFNVTQDRLIYPIPYRELQINTNLEQNSGY